MRNYRIEIENPIPLIILTPEWVNSNGVNRAKYPSIEKALELLDENNKSVNLFFGSFKSYGGTEKDVNGVYSIEDTANIETWYRPDIKSDCRIGVMNTGAIYEILGEPENINMRNQFLKFKVKRVKGKV